MKQKELFNLLDNITEDGESVQTGERVLLMIMIESWKNIKKQEKMIGLLF